MTAARAPPQSYENHSAQPAESWLRGVWKIAFLFWTKSICPKDFIGALSIFHEAYGRRSLDQYQVAATAGTSLWQVFDWSWKIIGPLSGGSTRTCDQSDLRKRHIYFGRRNTTA